MESAINELMTEFHELWSNCNITFHTSNDIDAFIMRAYEIGKVHSFQDGSTEGFKNGLKVGREDMIAWAENHYWDSLEKDRDIIIKHIKEMREGHEKKTI